MTVDATADLLRQHDPLRFGMVMAALPADRAKLAALYALNLELARAPFQSAEPMLAEMRLQWWVDRLDAMAQGTPPPLHDVLTPLWESWGADAGAMVPLAEARRRDCERQPFAGPDEVVGYVQATAGQLMSVAASALGAPDIARPTIADQALGCGIAAWLRALPQLWELGIGFSRDLPDHPRDLAAHGSAVLMKASKGRSTMPRRAAPALFAPAGTKAFLDGIATGRIDPARPAPEPAPFRGRLALARLALTGRWWV